MQLLMAVKERETGIVGDKVNFALLVSADHHHILHNTRCRGPGKIGQLESVAVKVDDEYRRWHCACAGGTVYLV